jgi:two-component system, NarL family, response regulator
MATPQESIRVLIADDHALFAEALTIALMGDEELVVIGVARDGVETVELTEQLRPDVVLMDVHMPLLDGVEATVRIRKCMPHTRVVMLTSDDSSLTRIAALEAGASSFLTKTCGAADLLDAVRMAAGDAVRTALSRRLMPFTQALGAA